MKYKKILLIFAIATLSLTACKKEENPTPETTAVEENITTEETTTVEETVTAITKEQFITLYENAKSIYAENPELFAENADIPDINMTDISDADIPVAEAITFKEAIQVLREDNIPEEILDEVLEEIFSQKGIINSETHWDDSLSMADGIEMLVKTLMQDPSMEEFNFKQGKVDLVKNNAPDDVDYETEYEEPIKEEVDYEALTKDERIEAATKDLVDDIINSYLQEQAQQNHIPVDDSDWGKVSDGTLANPTDWENRESNPNLAGGNFY